jgi:hypothetical protein
MKQAADAHNQGKFDVERKNILAKVRKAAEIGLYKLATDITDLWIVEKLSQDGFKVEYRYEAVDGSRYWVGWK